MICRSNFNFWDPRVPTYGYMFDDMSLEMGHIIRKPLNPHWSVADEGDVSATAAACCMYLPTYIPCPPGGTLNHDIKVE